MTSFPKCIVKSSLCVGLLISTCQADVIYNVNLDTSGLVANSNGPFALSFQLTSGDTTSGVVNTALLSQFVFGNGGSQGLGSPFPNFGNSSGDLGSSVSLNTSNGSFFNEFSQYFTPGDVLGFQLDLSNNTQFSGTPDEFTFQVIDSSLGGIPSNDPSGSNALLIVDLTGSVLQPQAYTTNGDGVTITPVLSTPSSPVPEPSCFWLVVTSVCLLVGRHRRIPRLRGGVQ